ncbi:MAG: hypothetical protein HYZ45_10545, partial [Burkholderiales bacterium]|nr:hypothetical protein [Burkholderiales bacterium]
MKPINKFLSARAGSSPLHAQNADEHGPALDAATHHQRKNRIVASTAIVLTLCAVGAAGVVPLAPDAANLPVKTIAEEMALPDLWKQISALDQTEQHFVR